MKQILLPPKEWASTKQGLPTKFEVRATPSFFQVIILMPVYRDWESASLLCQALDEHLRRLPQVQARVLLVDDGSPDLNGWLPFKPEFLIEVDVLRLRRNVGHQRAICAGLCHIHKYLLSEAVLIMDADGEDRPEDAVRLIESIMDRPSVVLFAERRKRFEGITFRIGYSLFRQLHHLLTGIPVRMGNFSVISFSALGRLAYTPELWSHYAGAVFKSRVQFECIPIDRGRRLRGRPQMTMTSLIMHGLAGIATFHETVATRLLVANTVGLVVLLICLSVVIGIRFCTTLAIPGWATYTVGLIVLLFAQLLGMSFSLVFSILGSRSNSAFVPVRDCAMFVDQLYTLVRRQ